MFDGIHCQYSEGLTIVTVWSRHCFLGKCAAAVCPEMPAPKTTTFAIKMILCENITLILINMPEIAQAEMNHDCHRDF
jgi:hypothetical protein